MPESYREGPYLFTGETFTFASDFTTRTSAEVGPDEFTTVEELDVGKGSSAVVGQGRSTNPLQAEGSIRGDIQDGGDSDITGRYRVVVLNEQNNVVDVVTQGTIAQLETTRANSLDGDITPFSGKEIYEPFKLGFQLKTDSGTATYGPSNSSMSVDGYRGEKLR